MTPLAALQARMLAELAAADEPEMARARLLEDGRLRPFHEWLRAADPAMWAVAHALVHTWSRPRPPARRRRPARAPTRRARPASAR